MARARNIKPSFFTNEELVELPMATRLLFVGLWTLADREGRLEDRPKRIKMNVFPADDVDVEAGLVELEGAGFLLRYEVGGCEYIQILNFAKHQNPHKNERPSSIPAPEQHGASTVQAPEQHGGAHADSHDSHESGIPPNPPRGAIGIDRFIEECKAEGVKPVPEGDPVFQYAEDAGIPADFLHLCWLEFRERQQQSGKRYKDWRKAFRNCVRGNWYRLWYATPDGEYRLSTNGVQAQNKHGREQ